MDLGLLVSLILLALAAFIFGAWLVYLLWTRLSHRCEPVPDENHPAKIQANFGDMHITLERRWSFPRGKWEYVLMGELPYRAMPPDYRKDDFTRPKKDGMAADDVKAMEKLEALLKSGMTHEIIKTAYATPEAQERQKMFVSGEKKGRCALDPP